MSYGIQFQISPKPEIGA